MAKERIEEKKERIKSKARKIQIHVKPVRNFNASLEKLLNSTEIDFSKSMLIPPTPLDLYDSINSKDLNEIKLRRYIEKVKRI